MTNPPPIPSTGRPRYFPGELLTAQDLNGATDQDDTLRALHHQILHGTGIATGLVVTGARGQVTVGLSAGYALDAKGRELLVVADLSVLVPPVASGPDGAPVRYALTVRWTEDAEAAVVLRSGPCGEQGAVRSSDAATVAWLGPAAVRAGLDIVLATVEVLGCALAAAPDPGLRRSLNPPPTPYSAAGATPAGATPWQVVEDPPGTVWAVRTTVDTSAAGFGDVPVYLARLVGHRELPANPSPNLRGVDQDTVLLDGTPYVEDPETGRFQLVVPLLPGQGGLDLGNDLTPVVVNPSDVVGASGLTDLLTTKQLWCVEWIGVQQ
jgi:hypothetical protein